MDYDDPLTIEDVKDIPEFKALSQEEQAAAIARFADLRDPMKNIGAPKRAGLRHGLKTPCLRARNCGRFLNYD